MREQRDARTIVVGERGVTQVGRKQKLILGLALMQILPLCQISVRKARVDDDLISFVCEALQQSVRHAEGPVLCII